MVCAAVLLIAGGAAFSKLGTEFLPELDEGDLVIFVEMPPSISRFCVFRNFEGLKQS